MLAAEVFGSPLCHRPKSRLHRRSIGVPNRSAPCPLRPAQTPAERPSSEASLSAVVRMRKAWQYGSTNAVWKYALWFVLRRDCFRRQLTTQPSADAARAASDCACGRSCISSIPIISSPSAETLSHKQRLNSAMRSVNSLYSGHSLAVPSADGPQRRRQRLSETTQLTVGLCHRKGAVARGCAAILGGSVWSPVRTVNSRATECGGSKSMRSTDLCKNSGFCSDTARYSFSEIVPFLQKCMRVHMHAHTRARRDKRLYLSVSSSLMRFATTRSATSPPCACSAAVASSFADGAPTPGTPFRPRRGRRAFIAAGLKPS